MSGVFDAVGDVVGGVADAVGDAVGGVAEAALPVAKVALPIAAAVFAPQVAGALFSGTALAGAAGTALTGAALGAGASAITGGNPLTGALIGGIGGYMGAPGAAGNGMLTSAQLAEVAQYPEALAAYQSAGMISPGMLSAAESSWNALPQAAKDSYLAAGYSPTQIGAYAAQDAAWAALPDAAKQAYIDAGYSPTEIGEYALTDSLASPTSEYDATNIVNKLLKGSPNLLGTSAGLLGSYLQGTAAKDAATTSALAQIEAAKIAAEAAKFKPVGVTSRFGASNFRYDPQGNLIGAGYTLAPDIKAQQDKLMDASGGLLNQYLQGQQAAAPMGAAGERAMALGAGYLASTPQEQAARYMAEQQALLAPSRERDLATLQNKLFQQGTGGLAIGGTSSGLMAANPEMEAFYNAQRMQDLNLAANATQGGMDYAKFGAGLVGTGGDLLSGMYKTQIDALNPYQAALGGATYLEGLGQGAMDIGTSIGAKTSTANANAGYMLAQGMTNAAKTMQPANAYSPWGAMLSGAGRAINGYGGQQQYIYDPVSGQYKPVNQPL